MFDWEIVDSHGTVVAGLKQPSLEGLGALDGPQWATRMVKVIQLWHPEPLVHRRVTLSEKESQA
jgi:hypothetical protein